MSKFKPGQRVTFIRDVVKAGGRVKAGASGVISQLTRDGCANVVDAAGRMLVSDCDLKAVKASGTVIIGDTPAEVAKFNEPGPIQIPEPKKAPVKRKAPVKKEEGKLL
jgi:hypothetical protein